MNFLFYLCLYFFIRMLIVRILCNVSSLKKYFFNNYGLVFTLLPSMIISFGRKVITKNYKHTKGIGFFNSVSILYQT